MGPTFGERFKNQGGCQTKEKKQKKKRRKTERHTEQMKQSERIRRDTMRYSSEREKKKTEHQVHGFKTQRAEKNPRRKRNWQEEQR